MSVDTFTVETLRAPRSAPVVSDFATEQLTLGGVRCEEIRSDLGVNETVVIWLHGGGYLRGTPADFRGATVPLAHHSRARILVPEYRLAPEHPFPAAYEDAFAVYRALLAQGVDPAALVVAGDSAGAGMAVALLVGARDAGLPLPACAIAHCPYADMLGASPSLTDPARQTAGLGESRTGWLRETYLAAGSPDPRDVRHSPVYADLTGVSPLLVQVGGHDPYHDDGVRLAANARSRGVLVSYHEYPDSEHVWVVKGTDPFDPEAERAVNEITSFIAEHIGSVPAPSVHHNEKTRMLPAADHLEILNLYARYTHAIDSGDGAAFAACFTEEGIFDRPRKQLYNAGANDLETFASAYGEKSRSATAKHVTTNIRIEADGDGAHGRAYLHLIFDGSDEVAPRIASTGHYEDTIVRTADGWRFAKRLLIHDGPLGLKRS